MRIKQWGQNQNVSKAKVIQNNNNPSARDWENQSRLANLLSLSQFNFNDVIKKSENSLASGVNNKLTHRKSPSTLNGRAGSGDLKEISPNKFQMDCSKPKKNKSAKRHILSCNQILSMAKKRDIWQQISLQPTKSHIFAHYGQGKTKKKFKREIMLSKNQNLGKPKNNQNRIGVSAQAKGENQKVEPLSNFNANYPLSMSHSYIAFSEKDSSLNNTANAVNKIDKKLSKYSETKYRELQNKLELIKMEHAATVIQKNWRGFLTRKLLLDYINNQQPLLVDRLSRIKAQKIEYENFEKMIPECNKFWTHRQIDCPPVFQNSNQNMIKPQKKNSLSQSSSELSHTGQKGVSDDLKNESSFSGSEEYQRKTPLINENLDENDVFESILEYQASFNVTSRERHNLQQNKLGNLESGNRLSELNCGAKQKLELRRDKRLKIIHQFNQTILPEVTIISECMKQDFYIKGMLEQFGQKLKKQVNVKIEKSNKLLKEGLMNSLMQFDEMLNTRQNLKKIKLELYSETDNFFQTVTNLLDKIPSDLNNSKNTSKCSSCKQDAEDENTDGKFLICGEIREGLMVNKSRQQVEGGENRNPVSEYFTIELPTEELSPFKPKISSGLETLKTFIENLHQECLQESENSSQTSYLCKVLKKHSQIGPQNMVERCLIQMLVEMLTGQYMLQDLILACEILAKENGMENDNSSTVFIQKWAAELQKWELGPIEQVSGNMEQSADVTERNAPSRKSKNFTSTEWLEQL